MGGERRGAEVGPDDGVVDEERGGAVRVGEECEGGEFGEGGGAAGCGEGREGEEGDEC